MNGCVIVFIDHLSSFPCSVDVFHGGLHEAERQVFIVDAAQTQWMIFDRAVGQWIVVYPRRPLVEYVCMLVNYYSHT